MSIHYICFIKILLVSILTISTVFCNECGTGPTQCSNETKYRSYDGSCNNLKNPLWGTSGSIYGRLLPAKYSDLNGSFALSVTGKPLPNARNLSSALYPDRPVVDKKLSLNAMAYGQFITHDLSFTSLSIDFLVCCSETMQYIPDAPPKCAPIDIPEDDPVYSKVGARCMSFPRTDTNRDNNCSLELEQVEQLTFVNIYMDLHMIYGISNETAPYLRAFKGGLLNSTYRHGQRWLPDSDDVASDCFSAVNPEVCYKSVDPRLDQNTHLSLLHVIFMREHQRIAIILGELNQHWDDERIFQETRNILIAIHQYISYYEWLPVFFGKQNLLDRKIIYEGDQFIDDYDEYTRPLTFNEFSHGANRHFHSMIADELKLSPDGRDFTGYVNMSDWMNNPSVLEQGNNFDVLARGLQCQYSMANDKYHGFQVTHKIFEKNFPLGLDLKSVDIHRSRDHGLPSYNDMREFCGLPKAETFDDFSDVIPSSAIEKLKQLYAHVDDVDFIVAGIMETFLPDVLTGHTFFCVLMKQYYRSRITDRFWYQNGRSGLTLEQLKEIHKVTISKLLCTNGKNITSIQPQGFYSLSESNDLVPCETLPSMDLTLWKEEVSDYSG